MNFPHEQDSSYASGIPSNQHLSNTATPESHTVEMQANHLNQENIIHSSSCPRRTVHPQVFEDTITGDWWKRLRVSPVSGQPSVDSSYLNSAETATTSILVVPEPRSYHEAKSSVHWDEWKKINDCEMESLAENNV